MKIDLLIICQLINKKTTYSKDVDGSLINVEGNYLSFGYGISLARATLDRSDIVNAIKHLESSHQMLKPWLIYVKYLYNTEICHMFVVPWFNNIRGRTIQGSVLTINVLLKTTKQYE